ncbi:MAG TPA: TetR/AcrR family transcriptional regulator [Clostridiaceae bacterium]|nr:TetR/AcrR family transcriptional regulator [Clostridiaceae bacterium]
MAKENYHHGNLPQALLRQGLHMLTEYGEEKLSLREVAKHCGVSPAAPYSHFKNKNDFIQAINNYVMLKLTEELQETEKLYSGKKSLIIELGLTYVLFFLKNPNCFSILFSQSNHAEAILFDYQDNANPAFSVLKHAAESIFENFPISEEQKHNILLAMWSMVHGLAATVSMPGVAERMQQDLDTEQRLRDILTAFQQS